MNPEVIVSVCITTYNAEEYIHSSLRSIIGQQTCFKFEIIISDDASTDRTVEIIKSTLKETAFENFRILESKKNHGINTNLKKAFTECKGKYIAILDADDLWIDSGKLQRQFEILTSDERLDYTYTNYIYADTNGNIGNHGLPDDFQHPLHNQFEKQLLSPYICICTIFFKRTLLDFQLLDQFIVNRFISQDYPLLLEVSKKYNGFYEKSITTKVILKSDSLSRPRSREKKLVYFQNCYDIGTFFIKKYGISQELHNKRDFYFYLKTVLLLWESDDFPRVRDFAENFKLISFIRYQPKSLYVYFASKNKALYQLFKIWTLRKRIPGK